MLLTMVSYLGSFIYKTLTDIANIFEESGFLLFSTFSRPRWKKVGVVDQLWLFPLKSGHGNLVTAAEFQPMGLKSGVLRDRHFCLIREGTRDTIALKKMPKMSQLEVRVSNGKLRLIAPGLGDAIIQHSDLEYKKEKFIRAKVGVFENVNAVRVNGECDKLASQFLLDSDSGFILIYHYSNLTQRPMDRTYTKVWTLEDKKAPAFGYDTAYTLSTVSSMNSLNSKLDTPIPITSFRSNIVIATDSDEPFQEDQWTGRIKIGKDVILRFNKPCHRCLDTNVNPANGEKYANYEPIKTLRKFRLLDPSKSDLDAARRKVIGDSPLFAINLSLERSGFAGIGDEVFVE